MDKASRKHTWARNGGQGNVTAWPAAITAQRGRVASLQTLQAEPQKIWKPDYLIKQGSLALAACPALKQGMAFSKYYLPQQKVFLLCWTYSKK